VKSPSSTLAPIALFAYRRPSHLRHALQALRSNCEASQTELFIFCDGARDPAVAADVEAVRNLVQEDLGFAATHIVCRESNYGLARNITEGVSEVLRLRESVIVVEDDIVVSPFFLSFMNEALNCYRDRPRVGSISGYCYPVTEKTPETYFVRGADCWGWATWRDRWEQYNPDGPVLLSELKARNLCHAFDFDGAMGFVKMLENQIAGRNDSWAVRWHASCFLRDLLVLYPGRSLAHNIGHDGSGTHSQAQDDTFTVTLSPVPVTVGGIGVEENTLARQAICNFLRKSLPPPANEPASSEVCAPNISAQRQMALRKVVLRWLPGSLVQNLRGFRNRLRTRPAFPPTPAAEIPAESAPMPPPPHYFGLHELDRQIGKYLDFDGGYFVELGANDGRFQSNTLHYEQYRSWSGVLVEPSPDLCRRCRENRSPRNHIVNAACVSFGYTEPSVGMIYSNAMSVSLNVETDIGDPAAHAELGRQFLRPDETVFEFEAPARTLNSILLEAKAPKVIDFLSLDVEGSEIEVLKGVDHETFRFRYLLIECRDIARLSDYLKSARYCLVEKFNEHDYLFAGEG
jgi:FkbM family methyltransferase